MGTRADASLPASRERAFWPPTQSPSVASSASGPTPEATAITASRKFTRPTDPERAHRTRNNIVCWGYAVTKATWKQEGGIVTQPSSVFLFSFIYDAPIWGEYHLMALWLLVTVMKHLSGARVGESKISFEWERQTGTGRHIIMTKTSSRVAVNWDISREKLQLFNNFLQFL